MVPRTYKQNIVAPDKVGPDEVVAVTAGPELSAKIPTNAERARNHWPRFGLCLYGQLIIIFLHTRMAYREQSTLLRDFLLGAPQII